MINYIYQLVSPQVFSIKYNDIEFADHLILRPQYMSICHADQRYYRGLRDRKVLVSKLPMALIHECCGSVVYDPSGQFQTGESVVPIPNVPSTESVDIYENYAKGSTFLSSGYDGFLREYVDMPGDRVVSAQGVPGQIAAITEFLSVAVHGVARLESIAHAKRDVIGIWGDGSLGFVVSAVLKKTLPNCRIVVIGKDERKLSHFSFVDETFQADEIPADFRINHAFECCGGEGSVEAINDIIQYIEPQGTVILMGVSENKVAMNTRDILEKGITFVGSSRSGKVDFLKAIELLRQNDFQNRLERIIFEGKVVRSIEDVHRVFNDDMNMPFKTVFAWDV